MPDPQARAKPSLGRAAGLRLRLALSYVFFFSALLCGLGLLFRQTLQSILHANTITVLQEEWDMAKAYLHVQDNRPVWIYDPNRTEQAFFVQRLRRIYRLADSQGQTLEISDSYANLGPEGTAEVRRMIASATPVWHLRKNSQGVNFLLRTGIHVDDGGKKYLLTIGRALTDNERILSRFTVRYFVMLPFFILGTCILGWLAAGRALRPLNEVTRAAQSISGRNLDFRLQPSGASDELDQLIETFNGMVDRLESSFNQMRQFTADVSHELRTPLTVIRGQLEVALMTARGQEQYREAILATMEDVERLSKVVAALLQLSQAESGQVTLNMEAVDLGEVLRKVVEQYQTPAEIEGLSLAVDTAPDCLLMADRIQLERLAANLLSNAMKYTSAGGSIRCSCRRWGDGVELLVSDTGRGIAEEHLPHIFRRFYRVPDGTADPLKGLGLGLSFVAWIAKVHRGQIQVESKPGHGTTFRILFPGLQRQQPPLPVPAYAREGK